MTTTAASSPSESADQLPSPDAEPRITMTEFCRIAKVSRVTITRRAQTGKYPEPIDRGREFIFDRRAVYLALGIIHESRKDAPSENPWERAALVIADREAPSVRGRKTA